MPGSSSTSELYPITGRLLLAYPVGIRDVCRSAGIAREPLIDADKDIWRSSQFPLECTGQATAPD
eukprot:m.22689 g.22689  ORF g.22689 m.22689 type:complete len:65 (+) comp9359_c0_seq2:974-1168(+)